MKKERDKTVTAQAHEIRPEYDFTAGVRGKHYRTMQQGYTIKIHRSDGSTIIEQVESPEGAVILEPDVRRYFPDSDAVNRTLRALISLIPESRKATAKK